jgi:spore coat polysaccharide biosynthesis protein SpsF
MNNLAIIQARMTSSRLPGKVMLQINDIPSIKFQIDRIRKSNVDNLVIATSTDSTDDVLVDYLKGIQVEVRRGPLEDVATRFLEILDEFNPENFLRLTADCPFVMSEPIDQMLEVFNLKELDYLSNANPPTFPDGLDVEIVKTSAFRRLVGSSLSQLEREHVTLGFHSDDHPFILGNYKNRVDLSYLRWTVDYPEDLEYLREIASLLVGKEARFKIEDVLKILVDHPEIINKRGSLFRNIALTIDPEE